jgi:hypothetical protein
MTTESRQINLIEWYKTKNEIIDILINAADSLDHRHINVCYTRIFGNTLSSIGGVMLTAGVATAPLSAGTSLPFLAVTGALIGCVGNTTSISSVIYEKISERKNLEKNKLLIEKFNHNTEALLSREASLYWNFVNLISPCLSAYNALNVCIKFFQFLDSVSDTAEVTGVIFTNALVKAGLAGRIFGKFALHVSIVLNMIGIAIDTVDTALAIKDIYDFKRLDANYINKPSKKLREYIVKFQKLKFEEIENRFIKFNAGISVINKGFYSTRFKVTYLIDDKKITAFATESFNRKQTITKEFLIPKLAESAFLKIEVLVLGFGCNLQTNYWKKIIKLEISPPYFKVFKLTGNKFNPKIKEINSLKQV